jgi:hypothetical protein
MTNFAERLVARSTGRVADAGVPLLMPRPVARFEPTGGLSAPGAALLEDTGMVSTGQADTSVDGSEPKAEPHGQNADASIGQTERIGPASRPAAGASDAFGRPLPPDHALSNRGPGDHVVSPPSADAAPSGADELLAMPAGHRQPGRRDARPNVEPTPPPFASVLTASGEPAAAPLLGDVMVPNAPPAPVAEQGWPTISIGKIEVQFLPKETPPGPTNVQTQRTRGFHAYNRARRGLR